MGCWSGKCGWRTEVVVVAVVAVGVFERFQNIYSLAVRSRDCYYTQWGAEEGKRTHHLTHRTQHANCVTVNYVFTNVCLLICFLLSHLPKSILWMIFAFYFRRHYFILPLEYRPHYFHKCILFFFSSRQQVCNELFELLACKYWTWIRLVRHIAIISKQIWFSFNEWTWIVYWLWKASVRNVWNAWWWYFLSKILFPYLWWWWWGCWSLILWKVEKLQPWLPPTPKPIYPFGR